MIYIDENGNNIDNYDLTIGYLVDHEWVDHPAVAQSGHYEKAILQKQYRILKKTASLLNKSVAPPSSPFLF